MHDGRVFFLRHAFLGIEMMGVKHVTVILSIGVRLLYTVRCIVDLPLRITCMSYARR